MPEVSFNVRISEDNGLLQAVNNLDTPDFLHNKSHATFIKREYDAAYRYGVLPIMIGIVASRSALAVTDNGLQAYASIFGFQTPQARFEGEETSMFVTSLNRHMAGHIDDPEAVVAAYQGDLIKHTNDILEQVESPLRLAPIEL